MNTLIASATKWDGETGYSMRFLPATFKNGDKSNCEFYFRNGVSGTPTFGAIDAKTGEIYETEEMPNIIIEL